MNLTHLKDQDLLSQTKQLVQQERQVLTQVLHHLREVERRKLFCDLGFQSLFEYAVKDLHYSEGQAGRRIQAMRLLKELPEVEEKIKTGALSLSNVAQAQSYFREAARHAPGAPRMRGELPSQISRIEKLEVLKTLENKTSREGQQVILKLQPKLSLSKERERALSEEHTEVRFVISLQLKAQLEEVRSLLGLRGAVMSFAELVAAMAKLSTESLKAKKFGKNRTQPAVTIQPKPKSKDPLKGSLDLGQRNIAQTPAQESKYLRHIPRETKYAVWKRGQGKCAICGTQRNLQVDHIQPVALGGSSTEGNLRLLCFNCNQRKAIKTFGVAQIQQHQRLV